MTIKMPEVITIVDQPETKLQSLQALRLLAY